jgi:hypothetical protein
MSNYCTSQCAKEEVIITFFAPIFCVDKFNNEHIKEKFGGWTST